MLAENSYLMPCRRMGECVMSIGLEFELHSQDGLRSPGAVRRRTCHSESNPPKLGSLWRSSTTLLRSYTSCKATQSYHFRSIMVALDL